jgi:hypothetical protein
VGRDLGVVYEMDHCLATNHNKHQTVLVTHSSSGVQLQVIVDVKWSLKWAKFGLRYKYL